MTRQLMLDNILIALQQLPFNQLKNVLDFTEILLNQSEREELNSEIQKLISGGNAFHFLNEEEDIYTLSDLKEIYK